MLGLLTAAFWLLTSCEKDKPHNPLPAQDWFDILALQGNFNHFG